MIAWVTQCLGVPFINIKTTEGARMGSRGLFWVMLSWRLGEHPSVSKTVKDPGGPLIYDIWEEKEDPQGPEKE